MERNHYEQHYVARVGWLRAAVLGANDGIVSTASLIVGVAAASGRPEVLVAGMAGLVAGALSMAAGEYVSVQSQADTERALKLRRPISLGSTVAVARGVRVTFHNAGHILGSSIVTMLAIGSIMYPALIARGYDQRFAIGAIASAGTLGIIIPPSIPMIIYACPPARSDRPTLPHHLTAERIKTYVQSPHK